MHVEPLFFLDDGITYKKIFYTIWLFICEKKYSD